MRSIMMIVNEKREDAAKLASQVQVALKEREIAVVGAESDRDVELVLVFGGDGTILWSAQAARERSIPLLGVNLGHMGFLAEAEVSSLESLVDRVAAADYAVEERMTLELDVQMPDGSVQHDWAINEAAIMRTDLAHPAHFGIGVDGQGVSTYGADGIILSTPTGSTAYSYSAGGPVVWPDTEAVLMVPLAAHGLFTRPLVVGPNSELEVSILKQQWADIEVWCDGIRRITAPAGTRILCRPSKVPVKLARLSDTPFSARLVAKFDLPVSGWRRLGLEES
ncbi:NAD kinase [Actinomyces sp.]|uniref:NAD kinase n=1 Tax=Actinomyces sp. TaxID=29317 RepID=UPI00290E75AD|nr:NAD kinase [Actinomyces sp.]MDU5231660.1 NAD kinase [Actinomyces sp.]MDU5569267.1 NAD kinase [Actinomyces sp.]MDU6757082.1 NAD kinase [Actinomyces sp.]